MPKILALFGSKKLAAVFGGIVAVFLTPVLNSKLHLGVTDAQVASVVGSILVMVLAFVGTQYHLDLVTNGATSTAHLVELNLAQAVAKAAPAGSTAAKVAAAAAQEEPPPLPQAVVDAVKAVDELVKAGSPADAALKAVQPTV